MTIKTYNIELNLSTEDKLFWFEQLTNAKNAFDECASYLKNNDVKLNLHDVHQAVYGWMRSKYHTLHSQAIIKIYKEVSSKLKAMKSNKHKNGNTPKAHSISMQLDKRLYGKLTKEGITLSGSKPHHRTLVTFNLFKKSEELFDTCIAKDPKIFYRNGKFYLSVPFEVQAKPLKNDTCIGVDLGMKQLFVTSEGKSFKDTKYLSSRRKLRYLKSKLQSKGTKSAKKHLKKLSHKEHNLSKDMCHRAVNSLLQSTDASYIVMEDLTKIKQNTSKSEKGYKRVRHNNALSQVPFYMFRTIAEYKAQLVGKQVETVSPTYTSQIDCRSDKRDGVRKGRRYYCSDGIVLDADYNAAINIGKRSNHPISFIVPKDGTITNLMGGH